MNPFGPPALPSSSNGNRLDDDEKPHVSNIIHGTWLVVYSWPALPNPTPHPPEITLGPPSKLEAVLFGCRCREEIADRLWPVKVYAEKNEVQACEMINEERQVAEALDLTTCDCRPTPRGEKFAALPINENCILHYQRLPNVNYTFGSPNTCKLLFKFLPSTFEITNIVEGLDVDKRSGDCTFMIKQD